MPWHGLWLLLKFQWQLCETWCSSRGLLSQRCVCYRIHSRNRDGAALCRRMVCDEEEEEDENKRRRKKREQDKAIWIQESPPPTKTVSPLKRRAPKTPLTLRVGELMETTRLSKARRVKNIAYVPKGNRHCGFQTRLRCANLPVHARSVRRLRLCED